MQQNHLVDGRDGPLYCYALICTKKFDSLKCLTFHLELPPNFVFSSDEAKFKFIPNTKLFNSGFQYFEWQILLLNFYTSSFAPSSRWMTIWKKSCFGSNFSLLNFFELKLSFKLKTCDWRFSSCLIFHWKQNRLWSKGDANKIPSRPKEALCFWGLVPETLQIEIVEKLVSARFLKLAVRVKTCGKGLNLATLLK